MYAFIEGRVAEKRQGELVVEAGGVGYLLLCSAGTVAAAPAAGESLRCYTHLSVREDAMELFGFATREERGMFLKLCGITGIGPRTALGILSVLPLRDLTLAIATGDVTALARAPGIGKKTAQRIVLELKDKMDPGDFASAGVQPAQLHPASGEASAQQEAVQALLALGYTGAEAARAVNQAVDPARDQTTNQLIMAALRLLGGQ